ncbi:MAG: UDP-3-O-(3-hydroxymyristoyl)glucosamine N-acyltransferase [Gammaproteobacteria bacterium]|nr:UDP-3-O-(3-hydroxymyristoyl)glucosamine N-acyltransferase [Gammaproteobacteria bacterium]
MPSSISTARSTSPTACLARCRRARPAHPRRRPPASSRGSRRGRPWREAAVASLTLGEIAVRCGCELRGDPGTTVDRVVPLGDGQPGGLSFLAGAQHRAELRTTRATAVVLAPADAEHCPVAALVARNPHAAFARIAALLYPQEWPAPGRHPQASIDPTAELAEDVVVSAGAVIDAGARIAGGCRIGPGCVVAAGAELAEDCRLVARVYVGPGVRIGPRAILHPGVVIGADGFGYAREGAAWVKVPQVGSVRIGCDVEIGANTTVDRGAIDDTVIADGVKLDNQIQIGHNVHIGEHTAVAACTGISGSTRIGRRCMIGGAVGIGGHLEIGDDVILMAATNVTRSISAPGMYASVIPLEPAATWRRMVARFKRLDSYVARLRALERAGGAGGAGHNQRDGDDD